MNLAKQIQLVSRIQADLRKEAAHHRGQHNDLAATDCSEQGDALDYVLRTLRAVASLTVALDAKPLSCIFAP